MALIEAKLGVSWSSIAGNTQGQLHLVTHNIKEQTGADASGDIFHESVHHSLLLFCLHPVKMAEPVQRSLSPGVSVVRFASWPVQGSQPWGIARTRTLLLSRSGLRMTF
jgi:hypothetical protein